MNLTAMDVFVKRNDENNQICNSELVFLMVRLKSILLRFNSCDHD
jgi:hypothetical protein